jgi:F0F1-type ATP synthase membrane subunit b/b'
MRWFVIFSGVNFFLLIFFFFYFQRRTGRDFILVKIRNEVNNLIADIEKNTDDNLSLLEERIGEVKNLLEDVDRRIEVYTRELDKKRIQEKAYAELGKNRLRSIELAEKVARPSKEAESPKNTAPPKDAGFPAEAGSGDAAEHKPADPRFIRAAREIPPAPLPLAEQAVELARAGFSVNLIANRLGISVSEVELAVAVADRKAPR